MELVPVPATVAVPELRLPEISTTVLAAGALSTCKGCKAAPVLTTPLTAGYPNTKDPDGEVICPPVLVVKSPERV